MNDLKCNKCGKNPCVCDPPNTTGETLIGMIGLSTTVCSSQEVYSISLVSSEEESEQEKPNQKKRSKKKKRGK